MTPLDTLLIEQYTGGVNMPVEANAGYELRVDDTGTNFEFRPLAQEMTGSGTWDKKSRAVLLRGDIASRVVTLPDPPRVGETVYVVDADKNAASFPFAVHGSLGLIMNISAVSAAHLMFLGSGSWILLQVF